MDALVALFRCRHCRVRLFERDAAAHLRRHVKGGEVEVDLANHRKVIAHFEEGDKDTFPRPGGQAIVYGRVKVGRGGRPKADGITAPMDETIEVDADEGPVNVLADLLLS